MKNKNIFLIAVFCVCPVMLFGQLKVQSNGLMVVNPSTTPATGKQFTVNSTEITGIYVNRAYNTTPNSLDNIAGIRSICNANIQYQTGYSAGVVGEAHATTINGGAPVYGVMGIGGSSSNSGKVFGVYGYHY